MPTHLITERQNTQGGSSEVAKRSRQTCGYRHMSVLPLSVVGHEQKSGAEHLIPSASAALLDLRKAPQPVTAPEAILSGAREKFTPREILSRM